jgi:hypothetical protein
MKNIFLSLILCFLQIEFAESKTLKFEEKPNSETSYAQRKLDETFQLFKNSPFQKYKIDLKIDAKLFGKESYGLVIAKNQITITGGDRNGLIYGTLGLIEDIRNNILPSKLINRTEKPQYPFRAIKYDLPWDTYRHSLALDLHIETCKDLKYCPDFVELTSLHFHDKTQKLSRSLSVF